MSGFLVLGLAVGALLFLGMSKKKSDTPAGGAVPAPPPGGGAPAPGQPGGATPPLEPGQPTPDVPGFGQQTIPGQPNVKPSGEKPTAPATEAGHMPFIIRFGDIPFLLATYYTGQGSRFFELEPINPHLGTLKKDSKGVSNYPGWIPGTQILIPAQWFPYTKNLPKPASVSASTTPPPAQSSGQVVQATGPFGK